MGNWLAFLAGAFDVNVTGFSEFEQPGQSTGWNNESEPVHYFSLVRIDRGIR